MRVIQSKKYCINKFVRSFILKIILLKLLIDTIQSTKIHMVVLRCSICSNIVKLQLTCKNLGLTHVTFGVEAYLLNDSYESNKYSFEEQAAFQVFCKDCHQEGHFLRKLMENHSDYFETVYNNKITQYNKIYTEPKINNLNSTINQQNLIISNNTDKIKEDASIIYYLERELQHHNEVINQISELNQQLIRQSEELKEDNVNNLFKQFQKLYQNDENKMKALSSCKQYSEQMSKRDLKFKETLNNLYRQILKDSSIHLFRQIQNFFEEHMNLLDKKIKYYEEDIKKMEWTKESVIEDCSRPSAVSKQQKIMRPEKLSEIQKIFIEEIERKKETMQSLKRLRSELKIEFIQDLGENSFVTDAQMHEKSRDMARMLIQV